MDAKELGDKPMNAALVHGQVAGITLRQHYAGVAMQGITAHPEFGSGTFTGIAETAVKQADALLAELAKET